MTYDDWLQRVPNQAEQVPWRLIVRYGSHAREVPMNRERSEVHLRNIGRALVRRGRVTGFRLTQTD